jgi:putative salt-induced outer membrane protein YdiY
MRHRVWVAVDDGGNRSLQMSLIYFFTKEGEKLKVVKLFVLVLFILAAVQVQISEAAEENKPKEEKSFSNELSFSLVNTTGNSDTLAMAGKNEMKYRFTDKWTGSWVAGALYNKSDGDKTAEKYFTNLRADYTISERWYACSLGSWLRDKFLGQISLRCSNDR